MQICKCVNGQVCKCASMQMCKYANLQVRRPVQSQNVCLFFSVSTRLMAIGLVLKDTSFKPRELSESKQKYGAYNLDLNAPVINTNKKRRWFQKKAKKEEKANDWNSSNEKWNNLILKCFLNVDFFRISPLKKAARPSKKFYGTCILLFGERERETEEERETEREMKKNM